jgi:hypothetical protein
MNHPIAGGDVSLDDLSVVHGDGAVGDPDVERLTVNGLRLHGRNVCRHHFASQDVVGKDGGQFRLVFGLEEVFHRALWKFGEGCIGRREDGEGTGTLQGLDEPRGFDGRYEGIEAASAGGDSDDVILFGAFRFSVNHAEVRGGGDERGEDEVPNRFHDFAGGLFDFWTVNAEDDRDVAGLVTTARSELDPTPFGVCFSVFTLFF